MLEGAEDHRMDARIVPRDVDVADGQRRPPGLGVGRGLDPHAELAAGVVGDVEHPQARVRKLDRRTRMAQVARDAGIEVDAGDRQQRGLAGEDRVGQGGDDDGSRPAHDDVAGLGALEPPAIVGADRQIPGRAVGEAADRLLVRRPGVRDGRHRGGREAVVDAVARDVGIVDRVPGQGHGPGGGHAARQEDQREDQEEPPGNAEDRGPRRAVTPSADSVTGTHLAPRTDPRDSDASVSIEQSPFQASRLASGVVRTA